MTDEGLTWMAGSHNTRRKKLDAKGRESLYWKPLADENMQDMIDSTRFKYDATAVIVFCEVYGPGIQDMHYGGEVEYRVFDMSINGEYLNWHEVEDVCGLFNIPTVPLLYMGPFTTEALVECTDGHTAVCDEVKTKFKGREGCVVKPLEERMDLDLPSGRVILKNVSCMYLERKNPTDNA